MDDDTLIAVDKLHEVARVVEKYYEESGLHVILRYCADELSNLRKLTKHSEYITAELFINLKQKSKIKKT